MITYVYLIIHVYYSLYHDISMTVTYDTQVPGRAKARCRSMTSIPNWWTTRASWTSSKICWEMGALDSDFP